MGPSYSPSSDPRKTEYLYVASRHGARASKPCKIGYSGDPEQRLHTLRYQYPFATDDLDFVRIYDCEVPAEDIEKEWKDKVLDRHKHRGLDEWFEVPADLLVRLLDWDGRLTPITLEEVNEQLPDDNTKRLVVEVPEGIHTWLKARRHAEGRPMKEIAAQALREYKQRYEE